MKILYHNPSISRHGQWAGERGRQFVWALEGVGADVQAIPPPSSPDRMATGRARRWLKSHLPRAWRGPLITVRLFQRGSGNTIRWSWRLYRSLRTAPPDVIVARYFEFEWTPLVVSRLLRRPLILETHSPFGLESSLRDGRPSRLARWVDRRMFAAADRIWVHTPRLRDLVAQYIEDPAKIALIPFGVETRAVVARPAEPASPVEIAFAGSFYPWHGIDELLTAYSHLIDQGSDVHLTLIGDGLMLAETKETARRLGLAEAVSFPGWLDRAELYDRLAGCHIGVAPYQELQYNYFEPVKILDFHMAGLPVVASAVGEIPRMVGDGETGLLVAPGDVGGLTAALAKLAADPDLREALGRAARARALHIEDTAAAVAELCHGVLGR